MQNVRERVRLLLGSEPTEVELDNPNLTLLEYLRNHARLTGTKEGCAEGDCGACTVIVGELRGNKLHYQSVNACIVLLGMLDNKQILTVEHIARDSMSLVPTAMAEKNGSQCGFCTPGFVMSLVTLQWLVTSKTLQSTEVDRIQINEHLAGNLCRCTGYGPIISAAQIACSSPLPESWHKQAVNAENLLIEWQDQEQPLFCTNAGSMFAAPRSQTDLTNILAKYSNATMVAGATDIGLWITKLGHRIQEVIYLGHVLELQRIVKNDTSIEIGASVSLQNAASALISIAPDFDRLVRRFGSRQIRSQATVCGNIANGSPVGDLPPAFIALGAKLRIASASGVREIQLEDFFVGYGKQDLVVGEYVESVVIPIEPALQFRCWKISKRFDQDISAVLGAFAAKVENGVINRVRICFGGMATTPKRAKKCEAVLSGNVINSATLSDAQQALAEDFDPITDFRASSHYRRRVSQNLLEKFFLTLSATDVPDVYAGLD